MGGRRQIFQLLVGEDVEGDQVDLGVAVLAGLGGGHFDNFARATLDHDVTTLAQRRALHGVGRRGTGIGALEGVLMLETAESKSARFHLVYNDFIGTGRVSVLGAVASRGGREFKRSKAGQRAFARSLWQDNKEPTCASSAMVIVEGREIQSESCEMRQRGWPNRASASKDGEKKSDEEKGSGTKSVNRAKTVVFQGANLLGRVVAGYTLIVISVP